MILFNFIKYYINCDRKTMQDTIAGEKQNKKDTRPSEKSKGKSNNSFEVDSLTQSTILLLIGIIHFDIVSDTSIFYIYA